MKKQIAILMVLVMCLSLVACSDPTEEFWGKYNCEAIESEGMYMDPEWLDTEAWIKLEEGGEGTFYLDEKYDMEWSIEDDEIFIEVDGEEVEGTIEDGLIELEIEDLGTIYLVNDDGELPKKVRDGLKELEGLFSGEEEAEAEPVEEAKEKADPVEEAPTGFQVTGAELGECYVEILGAEQFYDTDEESAIRIYYEFTNNSDETVAAWDVLSEEVSQDGYKAEYTYAPYGEEAPEEYNDGLGVRPGCTIRCIAEYFMKEDGGPLTYTVYNWYDDANVLTVEFDPANLPGKPADDFVIAPVEDPQWIADWSDTGVYDGKYDIYIDTAESTEDYDGMPAIRVYFEFTNNSDEAISPWLATYIDLYQDGIELDVAYVYDETETDELYDTDVAPGETVRCSSCWVLRSENPVEVEFDDWEDSEIGCIFYF